MFIICLLVLSACAVCRNVLSSQEVVDFITERIKPDESGSIRSISSIAEEVRDTLPFVHNDHFHKYIKDGSTSVTQRITLTCQSKKKKKQSWLRLQPPHQQYKGGCAYKVGILEFSHVQNKLFSGWLKFELVLLLDLICNDRAVTIPSHSVIDSLKEFIPG